MKVSTCGRARGEQIWHMEVRQSRLQHLDFVAQHSVRPPLCYIKSGILYLSLYITFPWHNVEPCDSFSGDATP